jgi:hypothetical protein
MQTGTQIDVQKDRSTNMHIDIKDLRPSGILYTDIDSHKQTNRQTEQKCSKVDRCRHKYCLEAEKFFKGLK